MMNNEIKMVALNDDALESVVGGHECITRDGGTLWKTVKRSARPLIEWLKEHGLI